MLFQFSEPQNWPFYPVHPSHFHRTARQGGPSTSPLQPGNRILCGADVHVGQGSSTYYHPFPGWSLDVNSCWMLLRHYCGNSRWNGATWWNMVEHGGTLSDDEDEDEDDDVMMMMMMMMMTTTTTATMTTTVMRMMTMNNSRLIFLELSILQLIVWICVQYSTELCRNQYLTAGSCSKHHSGPSTRPCTLWPRGPGDPRRNQGTPCRRRPDPLGRSSEVAGATPRGSEGTKHPGTGNGGNSRKLKPRWKPGGKVRRCQKSKHLSHFLHTEEFRSCLGKRISVRCVYLHV